MNEKLEKKYFQECKITDINDGDKTMTVIASTEDVDRYNEIMKIKGATYKMPMPFLWAHNRKDDLPPIGRIMSLRRKKGLKELVARVEFAPTEFASSIYELYKRKFMNGVSIGFIPHKDREPTKQEAKKGAKRVIEEWELLEISAVPIPANPNAMAESVKSGELQLPEMVYKDFGFEPELKEGDEVIDPNNLLKELKSEEDIEYWKLGEENAVKIQSGEEVKEEIKEKIKAVEELTKEPLTEEEIEEAGFKEIEEKPYENEHACRLNDPKKYTKFRRKNCEQKHDGKCIDVIYGRKKDGKSEIQALRYPKDKWTESAARSHCKSREGSFEAAKKEFVKIIKQESKKITLKNSPQEQNLDLEKLDQDEAKQIVKEMVQESFKELGDRLVRDFRKKILGIVDD